MATRSRIGIENEDGSVTSVYCHWDGYVEYNGELLVTHYQDREKVKQLISLGAISALRESIEAPEGHTFSNAIDGYTIVYHRDRGEDLSIQQNKDVASYFAGDLEEYGYLFTKEGEWVVKSGYSSATTAPQKVKDLISKVDSLIS